MSNDTLAKIKQILSAELGIDETEINLSSHLKEDFDADPISVADLIVKLEEEFDLRIPQNQASEFKTVEDILNYITDQTGDI